MSQLKQLKQLINTSCSAAFEIENQLCYFEESEYRVLLNEKIIYENQKTNVFSLYNLTPGTSYVLTIIFQKTNKQESLNFTTQAESLNINAKFFGAKGDGKNDDTQAIQSAIWCCPPNGRITIEAGTYPVKPLFLKSNITLELKKDAVLLASTNRDDYPILPASASENQDVTENFIGTWEGDPAPVYASPVTGFHLKNTSIVGEGTINGNGSQGDWWQNHKQMRGAWRPKLIFLSHCEDIILHGINIQNSPSWTLHPYFSKKLKFINLHISNPKDSPNTDGLNPESCEDVEIIGTRISVGDDCIAVKSGKIMMGSKFKRSTKNFIIRNCLMEHGHGAVVLGSEMAGGIRDFLVSQCLFINTDRGLRIKTRRGRGKDAIIDNISFENIKMDGVLTPFVINMYYHCDPDGKTEYVRTKEKLAVDDRTPYLGRFVFKDIFCQNSEVSGIYFYGLPEQKIESVKLENIEISFKADAIKQYPAMMCNIEPVSRQGIYINQAKNVILKNIKIQGHQGDAFEFHNIDHLDSDIK